MSKLNRNRLNQIAFKKKRQTRFGFSEWTEYLRNLIKDNTDWKSWQEAVLGYPISDKKCSTVSEQTGSNCPGVGVHDMGNEEWLCGKCYHELTLRKLDEKIKPEVIIVRRSY